LNQIDPDQFDRGTLLSKEIDKKADTDRRDQEIRVIKRDPFSQPPYEPAGNAKQTAQRIRSSLAQRLFAIVEDEDDALCESGSLATDCLVNARLGDRFIFSEPGRPGERLDTAFSLLIDSSGSMAGTLEQACLAATWAIADTLNGYRGMGLSFSIASFDDRLYLLKDWGQSWGQGRALSSYRAGGSTETYWAIDNRLKDMVHRQETRKILFLVTDGDLGADGIEPLVTTARAMNTEVVVMMIGRPEDKPDAPYLDHFSIVRPGEIATRMMHTVAELF
jgi:cobalamin biosynthesis protein CobT